MTSLRTLCSFRVLSLIPFLLVIAVLGAYPFSQVVRMAFSRVNLRGGGMQLELVGFQQFLTALGDPVVWHSLGITAVFVLATTLVSVVLGTALAILTDRATVLQGVARNVLVWPAIIAPVVVSVLWVLILNPQIGVLNMTFGALGWPEQGWLGSGVGAMVSIIAVDVWHWTPIVYLLAYSALKSIDPEVLEAASIDGASPARAVRYVILPLLTPAVLASLAIRTMMGIKAFDEMYLLTRGGPGDSTTIISLLIRGIVFDDVNLGYGSAVSLMTVLVVLALGLATVGVHRFLGRKI